MNLKTAARRLGVHYQTAYRWVRSGELVAVKVGSGYEISDAALARFQAQRAALERVPDVDPHPVGMPEGDQSNSLDLLDAMVDQVIVDASAVEQQAARTVATMLGDAAVVRIDETRVSYDHVDPKRAVLTGTLVNCGWRGELISERAKNAAAPVFVPQVAQREVRPLVREEFHQFLGAFGLFSAIAAPVLVDGEPRGTVFAGRDEPGRPYTSEDRDFVVSVADRVAAANERAQRSRRAWARRARLLDDLRRKPNVPLAEWLASTVGEDEGVAVADPDTHIICATKAFAALFGTSVLELGAIPEHVEDEDDGRIICDRLLDGEIDYFSIASGAGGASSRPASNTRVMMHGGVVRLPDATPRCIVVVAHPLPEVSGA